MEFVNCPHCGFMLQDDGTLGGQSVLCPHCAGHFQMPQSKSPFALQSAHQSKSRLRSKGRNRRWHPIAAISLTALTIAFIAFVWQPNPKLAKGKRKADSSEITSEDTSVANRQAIFGKFVSVVDLYGTDDPRCQDEWERLRQKYELTYEQSARLLSEGIKKKWPFPPLDPSDLDSATRRSTWLAQRQQLEFETQRLIADLNTQFRNSEARINEVLRGVELAANGEGESWGDASSSDRFLACLVFAEARFPNDESKRWEAVAYYKSFVDAFYASSGDALRSKKVSEVIAVAETIRTQHHSN